MGYIERRFAMIVFILQNTKRQGHNELDCLKSWKLIFCSFILKSVGLPDKLFEFALHLIQNASEGI